MISPLIAATMKTLADLVGAMRPPSGNAAAGVSSAGGSVEGGNLADAGNDLADQLVAAAATSEISIVPARVQNIGEITDLLTSNHYTIIVEASQRPAGEITIVKTVAGGGQIECLRVTADGRLQPFIVGRRWFKQNLRGATTLVGRHAMQCDAMTTAGLDHSHAAHGNDSRHDSGHDSGHHHASPLTRALALLKMDLRDIYLVALFALVAGILSLATPLAVESLVNVVSWGAYIQPLLWLGLILLVSLGLGGVFKILQTVIVEMIQRRQFVRIVGDLAHRYPMANAAALAGQDRAELGNRFFDIMTIQKATNTLLLDGISLILSAAMGMLLLAFYHPFLLGFDLVLLITMIAVTWTLGRGGVRTAVEESMAKYAVAHWLQDVLMNPGAFKIGGGAGLAIDRCNRLTANYLIARQRQFRVVLRQTSFAIFLQVIASTTLLALGGYLVITGQLTLGQLVASELVVTVVVGAFSKAGKSIEKYYDLMAGVDKVGHLLDIEMDRPVDTITTSASRVGAAATWSELAFASGADELPHLVIPAGSIAASKITAISGDDVEGRTKLVAAIAGSTLPDRGTIRIDDVDAAAAAGHWTAYIGRAEIFHGSIADNVDLGRDGIDGGGVRSALRAAGLADAISALADGLHHPVQSGGHPLTLRQRTQLMLARGLAGSPRLMIVDRVMDGLSGDEIDAWIELFESRKDVCSVVIHTARDSIAARCDLRFNVRTLNAPRAAD